MFSDLFYRLRALFRRNAVEGELDEELRFHFNKQVEKYVKSGVDRAEAVRRARLAFGGIEQVKAECREARGTFMLETLIQDLGYALRMWRKNPGFTLAAITAIGLGIGINTAVFSFVSGALSFDPGIDRPDRLVLVSTSDAFRRHPLSQSDPDLRNFRAEAKPLVTLAAYRYSQVNWSDKSGLPERYVCVELSANGFSVIGRGPILGRSFQAADERGDATPVVMLTHRVWQDRYGRDPSIIGRTIRVNEVPRVVIGVMPAGMRFPEDTDLWIPQAAGAHSDDPTLFGRLADGVTLAAARSGMDSMVRHLANHGAEQNQGPAVDLSSVLRMYGVYAARPLFAIVLCAVGFVLLIACANVANLLLARAAARSREISIRIAIGAGRRRIIRQLLVESVALSLAGGFVGWLLAVGCLRSFDASIARFPKPPWLDLSMNTRVLIYLAAISIGTGILFGLAPALHLAKVDVNSAIKDGGHGAAGGTRGRRLSSMLVVFEVALSVVLLVGAGLLMRSAVTLYGTPIGVNAANVLTMQIDLPEAKYPRADDEISFHRRLKDKIEALPGVEASALASNLPGAGSMEFTYELEGGAPGDSGQPPITGALVVSRDYFRVMEVRPRRGRLFTEQDEVSGAAAAIVNESFATKFWPAQDPIGKHIRLVQDRTPKPWLTVVGVIADIHQDWADPLKRDPLLYVPYAVEPQRKTFLVSRTNVPPATLVNTFRRDVQSLDENLPVYDVRSLENRIAGHHLDLGIFAALFTIFAAIGLILASVGLYAVIAHSVSQRTREIGLRMAVGGSARDIVWLVFVQGIRQIMFGLTLGLLAAFAVTRVLRAMLIGVSPGDPMTFVGVVVVLVLTGVLACAIPARRAVRVDPVVALRCE